MLGTWSEGFGFDDMTIGVPDQILPSPGLSPGHLAVLRVGDGLAPLTNGGTSLFIEEYNTNGTPTQTIPIPNTGIDALVINAVSVSEGTLTRSPNGRWICFGGFNTRAGYPNIDISLAAELPRGLGVIDSSGKYTLVANSPCFYDQVNIRGCVSDGTNNFWGVGSNVGTHNGGLNYFGFNDPTSAVCQVNFRVADICNGDLYASRVSGIYKFSGAPVSNATPTQVIVSSGSPYAFAISPDGNLAYVTDDSTNGLGGIMRYKNNLGSWSLDYTLGTGLANTGAFGITVDWARSNPVIFATTFDGLFTGNAGNRIIRIIDTGATSTAATVATARGNTVFRGIAFTPTLFDTQAPQISCPSNLVLTADAGQCNRSNVTFTVNATDNSGTNALVSIPSSGSTFSVGLTIVTNTATDPSGNHSSCTFTVTVLDTEPPQIFCPGNLVLSTDTGRQTRSNVIFSASAFDNCAVASLVSIPPSGSTFPMGITIVTNTATDPSGHQRSCTFIVTVNSPIVVTLHPVSQVVQVGQSVIFTAAGSGYPMPSYQWQLNGVNISGATGASYAIPSSSFADIGFYSVVIANSVSSNVSSSASLTFLDLKMLASVYLDGPIGASYQIESTPAVGPADWTIVTNITVSTQPYIYVDFSSATKTKRFYRAVPQQ